MRLDALEPPPPTPLGELPTLTEQVEVQAHEAAAAEELLALWSAALRQGSLEAMACAALAELAAQLGCQRIGLALRDRFKPGAQARLVALSTGTDLDPALSASRQRAAACDEALDAAEPLLRPGVGAATVPAAAHELLLMEPGVRAVLSVPVEPSDPQAPQAGVLLFELPRAIDPRLRARACDAAAFLVPLLLLKAQAEMGALARMRLALASGPAEADQEEAHDGMATGAPARQRRRWRRALRTGLAAAALGLLLVGLLPAAHHVVAPVRIEGLGQRIVAAPAEGFLAAALVLPGQQVKAGQLLAQLDDREATLELQRTQAERNQHEQQYADALTRDDAALIAQAQAKLAQSTAQHVLAQARLARVQMVAPFDGVVLSGDLRSSVGAPVQRGQELLVVAPGTGWRAVAEVDEQDAPRVAPGQPVRLLFGALPGQELSVTLSRVAPVASVQEGRNVFEAEGVLPAQAGGAASDADAVATGPATADTPADNPADTPAGIPASIPAGNPSGTTPSALPRAPASAPAADPPRATAGLSAGLRGVARIEVGRRAPLAVWAERVQQRLQRFSWSLQP